ncbi:radical SAM protein, partial [uncultured Methanobrevibacter sp.]
KAHNLLLCGYYGNDKADKKKLEELKQPTNAAISLAGEPTLYPEIDELIGEFNHRGFSTFLVSNGQYYKKLENLTNEPTQTYLSLDAPNSKIYKSLCNPQINDGWDNLNKSLNILNGFSNNTAIRITMVKGKNMTSPEDYAKLIEIADPTYVEVKAYMCVGSSRERLTLDNMPTYNEVKDFASKIGSYCGRKVTDGSEVSRVVLLTKE